MLGAGPAIPAAYSWSPTTAGSSTRSPPQHGKCTTERRTFRRRLRGVRAAARRAGPADAAAEAKRQNLLPTLVVLRRLGATSRSCRNATRPVIDPSRSATGYNDCFHRRLSSPRHFPMLDHPASENLSASWGLVVWSLNLIYQFWVHTERIDRLPRWFEFVFNTPSHHRVHHGMDPVYLDKNYGGILIIWDRLFGSFQPELRTSRLRRSWGLLDQIWRQIFLGKAVNASRSVRAVSRCSATAGSLSVRASSTRSYWATTDSASAGRRGNLRIQLLHRRLREQRTRAHRLIALFLDVPTAAASNETIRPALCGSDA